MRRLRRAFLVAAAVAAGLFVANTDLLSSRPPGAPVLLAHRGIAQRFDPTGVTADTCTATRIAPPSHRHLENTIASMRAAFAAGADVVEFDVHPTTDGHFVVFHDWTLDCRTDGTGVTRERPLAALKALDIGHGYTADGGKTFPFRGRGVGLMPTLDEVLAEFPDRRFLVNVKSRDPREGEMLADALARRALPDRARLMVYGDEAPVRAVKQRLPELRVLSRATLLACLWRYVAHGWTGVVPDACRHALLVVPVNVAPWLWGWPSRFLDRMEAAGAAVFVLGPYAGGGFTTGLDTPDQLARLPAGYSGGIWTDEIESVARMFGPPAKP